MGEAEVLAMVRSFNPPGFHLYQREAWIAPCPFCKCGEDEPVKRARAMRGMSVNLDGGAYRCKKCDAHGHVTQMAKEYGVEVERKPRADRPAPKPKEPPEKPEPIADAQRRFAELPAVADYLKGRGFNKEAVTAWGLGAAIRRWGGDPHPTVAIPLRSESGAVIGYKYRRIDNADKNERFSRTRGTPQTMVGLHLLPTKPPFAPVAVTEGELDAVALWQFGIRPVVSIPSGAGAMQPEWAALLDRFGQIFLVYDDDEDGEKGARKAAEAFGITRCKRVILPRKDAAECLEKGFDASTIRAAFNNATPMRPEGIPTVAEWYDKAIEWVEREDNTPKVSTGIYDLDETIGGGLASGDLTLIYGRTSHGKSTLAFSILLNALRAGVWSLSASAEYIDAHHARIVAGQIAQRHGFRMNADDMRAVREEVLRLPLVPVPDSWDYQTRSLPELLRWASAQGVRVAVLDPLDHVMPENEHTRDYYGDVARFVRKLRDDIKGMSLHLIVVAPVTKAGELAGRNSLTHDAWNLLEVVRDDGATTGPTGKVQVIVHKCRRTPYKGRHIDLLYLRDGARIVDEHDQRGTGVPF